MECYYHPSVESTDVCAICGKSICKECGLEIAGKIYCKDCLEKIVGLSLDNSPQKEVPQEPERFEKEQPVEMSNLTQKPEEVQFSGVADDSPYNIKENINYEGGLESKYEENYQPSDSLYEAIENNQVPKEPVGNIRQEYVEQDPMDKVLRQPENRVRNEYDYIQRQPQAPPAEDYIYPDHSYQPEEVPSRAVEDKYERYLDDLYFDEREVPLNEQLARDEAKYGSLTKDDYQPRTMEQPNDDEELERRIRAELMRKEQGQGQRQGIRARRESIHNIQYEEEKEPYGTVDILLTIILVLVILIVLFYLVYIFKLSATYPTFIDAVFGLKNPGALLNALLH